MQSLAKGYEKASLLWKWGPAGHTEGKVKSVSVEQDLKADAQVIEKSIFFI